MTMKTEAFEDTAEAIREIAARDREIELLRAQRDAWKAEAEHQYGLIRALKYEDVDYPVTGALDSYAAGKYPELTRHGTFELRTALQK